MKCCKRRWVVSSSLITLSIILLVMTVERMVFDTLGQMWGTLIINGMTALCSLVGIMGACIPEKIALGVFSVWSLISIGLNIIIILIYNDIGLQEKEHYLGLSVGNDNWWRTHGIGCEERTGSGAGDSNTAECTLSYATIETIHAAAFILLTSLILILSLCLLFTKKKGRYIPEDDESFNFVSVSHDTRPQRHCRKWSYSTYDTTVSLWLGCVHSYIHRLSFENL